MVVYVAKHCDDCVTHVMNGFPFEKLDWLEREKVIEEEGVGVFE